MYWCTYKWICFCCRVKCLNAQVRTTPRTSQRRNTLTPSSSWMAETSDDLWSSPAKCRSVDTNTHTHTTVCRNACVQQPKINYYYVTLIPLNLSVTALSFPHSLSVSLSVSLSLSPSLSSPLLSSPLLQWLTCWSCRTLSRQPRRWRVWWALWAPPLTSTWPPASACLPRWAGCWWASMTRKTTGSTWRWPSWARSTNVREIQ